MASCPCPTRCQEGLCFEIQFVKRTKPIEARHHVRRWAAGCWYVGGASVTFLPRPTQNPAALSLPLSISTISPQTI